MTEGQDEREQPTEDYAALPAWFQSDVSEFYADTVNVNMGPYGMSLTLGVRGFEGPVPKVRIYIGHELGVVLAGLLKRVLLTYEIEHHVRIQVPDSILAELQLRDADLRLLEDEARAAEDRTHGRDSEREI